MSFATRLAEGRFATALEITPPKTDLAKVLLRRARLLGDAVHAINVIQRPGRLSSLDASIRLRQAGLQPAWHLVNRGRTRNELRDDLARAHEAGIEQILCIRGDHDADDHADTPKLHELVAMACDTIPGIAIGATLNQYAPDRDAVFRNLAPKLRAGASYVQTQPVFDLGQLRPAAERLRAAFPETKVIAMAMPLLSPDDGGRIAARLGVALPDEVQRRLEAGSEAAWGLFDETLAGLVKSGLVDGVAIMTFEMDPSNEIAARIVTALRKSGATERCD